MYVWARRYFWAATGIFAFEFIYGGSAVLLTVALVMGNLMATGAFVEEGEG
jgi:hypothetical protein